MPYSNLYDIFDLVLCIKILIFLENSTQFQTHELMNLSSFIRDNMEAILQDWEDFARSIQPKSGNMNILALRDDTKEVMAEVADELETLQGMHEQAEKSKGRSLEPTTTTAARHGLERLEAGFGIVDMISEYRALRASVIRLWDEIVPQKQIDLFDLIRFNEAIDQRIHEAVVSFSMESEMRTRQFDTVLSSSPDHCYILDPKGKFLYANNAMLEAFHTSLDELVGKSHFDLNFPDAPDLHKTLKEVTHTATRGYGELKYCSPSGELRYFEYVYTPVLDGDKRVQAVASTERDITARKQAAEALRQNREQLLVTNNELEARVQESQARYLHSTKLAEVGKWSASIAHELNNPMQAVMVFLRGLRQWSTLEEDDSQILDSVIGEIDRMRRLIRNLSDLNRPSSGKKDAMDVNASIDSLLLLCKSDLKHKGISVAVYYDEKLPHILAVPDQIKQVLLNLLRNAADASRDGGVITIRTWREEERIAVSIKDNGAGIPPEQMDLIFQPFHTTKPEGKGTGLGLSVSKEIVQNHNGQIRVESKPREGSVFTVLLPIDGE